MKKVKIFGFFVLGLGVIIGLPLFFGEHFDTDKKWSWRYRLTIEVNTPEGIKTGSSVRQIDVVKRLFHSETVTGYKTGKPVEKKHYNFDTKITGESVVVDMGKRGVLFSTIDWDSYNEVLKSFDIPVFDALDNLPSRGKADLPLNSYPMMVTFTDIDDPKTVQIVLQTGYCTWPSYRDKECPVNDGPYIIQNNLEKYFGKGVSIKSVTVEITDDPLTQGIVDQYLPKFGEKFWKWRRLLPYGDDRKIGKYLFKRSVK
jgi:hypothetical protein